MIKVALKNLKSRQFQHNGDLRPEEIIFSIEIFSALFVTFCMQQSTSLLPVVMLTVLDFLHACLALQDIHRMARDIEIVQRSVLLVKVPDAADVLPFSSETPPPPTLPQNDDVKSTLHYTSHLLERMGSTRRRDFVGTGQRWRTKIWPSVTQAVDVIKKRQMPNVVLARLHTRTKPMPSFELLPHAPNNGATGSSNSVARTDSKRASRWKAAPAQPVTKEDKYVRKVLHLLHATEYIVLVEFTEVIIPLVYCTLGLNFVKSPRSRSRI